MLVRAVVVGAVGDRGAQAVGAGRARTSMSEDALVLEYGLLG